MDDYLGGDYDLSGESNMNWGTVLGDTATGAASGASYGGLWGGVAGGVIGLAGGIMQNNAQQAQVNQQEQFQQQMSSTAYQRSVTDMEAAGLNPMFATGGGGASTPSGSIAQMGNPIQSGMASAGQVVQLQQAQQGMDLQKANTAADVGLKMSQSQAAAASADLARANAEKSGVETGTAKYQQSEEKVKSQLWNAAGDLVNKSGMGWKMIYDQFLNNKQQSGAQNPYGSTFNVPLMQQ